MIPSHEYFCCGETFSLSFNNKIIGRKLFFYIKQKNSPHRKLLQLFQLRRGASAWNNFLASEASLKVINYKILCLNNQSTSMGANSCSINFHMLNKRKVFMEFQLLCQRHIHSPNEGFFQGREITINQSSRVSFRQTCVRRKWEEKNWQSFCDGNVCCWWRAFCYTSTSWVKVSPKEKCGIDCEYVTRLRDTETLM